jgi:hypothetical protein
MSEPLTSEHFRPHLNKVFRIEDDGRTFTLTRVDSGHPDSYALPPGMRRPFNLIFDGPVGDVVPAGLYTLRVEDGPSFDLYVMPIYTPAAGRQDYQAAFN